MKYLFLSLILLSNSVFAQKYVGENCVNLYKIQVYIESVRDSNIKLEEFLSVIDTTEDIKINKAEFKKEIVFIYNLPINVKISKHTKKQCMEHGYVNRIQT